MANGWQDCSEELRSIADAIDREAPLLQKTLDCAGELLEAYIEEHGGDMPTSKDHPAHRLRAVFEEANITLNLK